MNTEHQLKLRLAWSSFQKSIKLKQKWYRSNSTAKNDAFTFLLGWIDFWWGGSGEGGDSKFLAGGDSPHPPSRKNPIYIYIYIYIHTYTHIGQNLLSNIKWNGW